MEGPLRMEIGTKLHKTDYFFAEFNFRNSENYIVFTRKFRQIDHLLLTNERVPIHHYL